MAGNAMFGRAVLDARRSGPVLQLQALRGLAAVIVVVYHAALFYDYGGGARSWMTLVFNAHAAVVSFFVLSGFVLTLSLMRVPLDGRNIVIFYVRRLFRIYPALWAACALAIAYVAVFGAGGTMFGTDWARMNLGAAPLTPGHLAPALAGLKPHLPLPIWSMAIELGGSLAMPFVIIAMRRSSWLFAALVAALAAVSLLGGHGLLLMPVYLVDFAIGAAVALAVPMLRDRLAQRRPALALAVAGGVLLWFGRVMVASDYEAAYHDPLTGLIEAIGAALLIAVIHVRPMLLPVLSDRRAIRLGDHSYSLYLLHQPVLGIVAALGALLLPGAIVAAPGVATLTVTVLTLVVTLPLARWSFGYVELPGIRAGRRVVAAIEERDRPRRAMAPSLT